MNTYLIVPTAEREVDVAGARWCDCLTGMGPVDEYLAAHPNRVSHTSGDVVAWHEVFRLDDDGTLTLVRDTAAPDIVTRLRYAANHPGSLPAARGAEDVNTDGVWVIGVDEVALLREAADEIERLRPDSR